MLLKIQYHDMKYDYVDSLTLDRLITSREIRQFFRPSENTWVRTDEGPLRGMGGSYSGPERRLAQPSARQPLKAKKAER
jgi:hypothetical protein